MLKTISDHTLSICGKTWGLVWADKTTNYSPLAHKEKKGWEGGGEEGMKVKLLNKKEFLQLEYFI